MNQFASKTRSKVDSVGDFPRDIAVTQRASKRRSGTARKTGKATKVAVWAVAAALGFGAWAAPVRHAEACGGCFHVQTESTVVTDHRMAFSISKQQTILWDQIRYQGSPQDFAWVLPVGRGARVELSSDRWMSALDALTQPRIVQPLRTASGGDTGGGGIGCSSSDSTAFESTAGGKSQVEVVSEKAVGPYQTVILRSENPMALEEWLVQNGYKITDDVKPIVREYVKEGLDFLALRLRPEATVRQMEPVRVISPGADVGLPLRMVAAGVGANVGLTLYVIGEGRYQAANFPNGTLDVSKLFWNFNTSRSNYQELSAEVMAQASGRTWISESSLPNSAEALRNLYRNSRNGSGNSGGGEPEPFDAGAFVEKDAGSGDSGTDSGVTPGGGGTDGLDDYALAVEGMPPGNVWVTRLRANLPAQALGQDLKLEAAPKQVGLSTQYLAQDPDPVQAQSSIAPVAPRSYGTGMMVALTMGWLTVRLRRRRTVA
jgi:hypothetical protein